MPETQRALRTIHLKGTPRCIGRQHAEQLGAEVHQGMLAFYRGALARLPRASAWVARPWLRRIPPAVGECLAGLAEASAIPERELRLALVIPDVLPYFQGALSRWAPSWFAQASKIRLGCSSFISVGERFLVGRNLDFPGVGYWDRFPVLQSVTPSKGLRSVSFTSSGIPVGGITGINEAQVFVAIHQHYCRSSVTSGTLPFLIAERILAEARTLAQAQAILEQARVSSGWAFVLADGKDRSGAIWETTPNGRGVLHSENPGVISHANAYQTAVCQSEEFVVSARMGWDNQARQQRLRQLVASAGAGLTPTQACAALGDCFDPYWGEEKVLNRTVSLALNIQSVVLDPERMEAWVAQGPAPFLPGHFQKVDLGKLFSGGSGLENEFLNGFAFADPAKAQAKREYVRGFAAWLDGHHATALAHAEASLAASFTPEVALTAAICRMKSGDLPTSGLLLQRAASDLERRMGERTPPPEYFEVRLFQGRLADLQGKRREAKLYYQAVAEHPGLQDSNLARLAQQNAAYTRRRLAWVRAPFSAYAPFV